MPPHWMTLLATLATLPALALPPATTPNFQCTDGDGAQFKIWITAEQKEMQVTEKGKTRSFPLSEANVGRRPKEPGFPLVYNGWKPEGKTLLTQLDMSVEFVTHYTITFNTSQVKVSLVVDHRERTGLACKGSRYSAAIVPMEIAPAPRYAAEIREISSLRLKNGTLTPVGVLGLEAYIRRMFLSADFKKKEARDEFIQKMAPGLKKVDPQSVKTVGSRLSPPVSEFWKTILTTTRYQYYPEVERYTTWVLEGAQPALQRDLDSIRAGFASFVRSGFYNDNDTREFFAAGIKNALKSLSDTDVIQIKDGLKPDAKTFLMQLWTKAVGKRTLASFPDIADLANDILALVDAEEFDASQVRNKIVAFLKSRMALEPEARTLFIQATSPHVKKLSPRQREDVMAWFVDAEKPFFLELLGEAPGTQSAPAPPADPP